jgi:hypothetical protein
MSPVSAADATPIRPAKSAKQAKPTAPAAIQAAPDDTGDVLASLAEAVKALAAASQSQSESMLSLARSTAESVRLAAGSYVFQLRDRFDELLPVVQVGASESSWEVEEFPDAFSQLVFHPGDVATANLRVAVSQAAVKRIVRVHWTTIPEGCSALDIDMNASSLHRDANGVVHLDNDVSLFIDAPLVAAVGDLEPGIFTRTGILTLEISDPRPEGAVSIINVEIALGAVVVSDDDGIGLDGAHIVCTVRPERRVYWLDKAERLPLQLPTLG